jgi:LPS-assembly protein
VKVGEPYKRLPQLTLTANRPELPGGATFLLASEFVDFHHPVHPRPALTAYPQLALPLQTAAFYVTPKIGLHATRYEIERRNGDTGDESSPAPCRSCRWIAA